MAAKSFSVNNAAASSKTFTPTVPVSGGTQYVDASQALTAPRIAVIKHTIAPVSQSHAADRHYVQFLKTTYDSVGKAQTSSIGVSLVISRNGPSATDVADLVAFAKNFLGDSTILAGFEVGDY